MKPSKLQPVWLALLAMTLSLCLSAQEDTSKVLSQYLFPEFSKGIVKLKSGSIKSAMMNYNTLSEKMVFIQNNKFLDLINTEMVDTVYLSSKKFIPNDKIFLEVINESAISLYFQCKGSLIAPGKPSAYGGTSQTASISQISTIYDGGNTYNLKLPSDYTVRLNIFYWIKLSGVMQKFLTEKQFLKLFPSKETELKKFIKGNDISFKKRDDVIRLISYCNQIN